MPGHREAGSAVCGTQDLSDRQERRPSGEAGAPIQKFDAELGATNGGYGTSMYGAQAWDGCATNRIEPADRVVDVTGGKNPSQDRASDPEVIHRKAKFGEEGCLSIRVVEVLLRPSSTIQAQNRRARRLKFAGETFHLRGRSA